MMCFGAKRHSLFFLLPPPTTRYCCSFGFFVPYRCAFSNQTGGVLNPLRWG